MHLRKWCPGKKRALRAFQVARVREQMKGKEVQVEDLEGQVCEGATEVMEGALVVQIC